MNEEKGSAAAGNPKSHGFAADMNARSRLDKIEATIGALVGFAGAYGTLMEQQRNTLPSNHIGLADAASKAALAVKEASNG